MTSRFKKTILRNSSLIICSNFFNYFGFFLGQQYDYDSWSTLFSLLTGLLFPCSLECLILPSHVPRVCDADSKLFFFQHELQILMDPCFLCDPLLLFILLPFDFRMWLLYATCTFSMEDLNSDLREKALLYMTVVFSGLLNLTPANAGMFSPGEIKKANGSSTTSIPCWC